MPPLRDLTGQKYHRLTVLHRVDTDRPGVHWRCRCDCGNEIVTIGHQVRSGHTKSCGCLQKELAGRRLSLANLRHGMSDTREYRIWNGIKNRCNNPNVANYPNYGGRGIRVCERWQESFEAFYADVGPCPSAEHSLDRTDVDGHYEPANVRWATSRDQVRNKRTNHLLTCTLPIATWADMTGLKAGTILDRIERGWTVEDALTLPVIGHSAPPSLAGVDASDSASSATPASSTSSSPD